MIESWSDAVTALVIVGLLVGGLAMVGALTMPSFTIVVTWAGGTLFYMNVVCSYAKPKRQK